MIKKICLLVFFVLVTTSNGYAQTPSDPACSEHNNNTFHTLWNSELGCHYDHEHGKNPFTPEVAVTFPGFDLQALLGNVQIGHTNPSSEMENTHKHGGFKWQVDLTTPQNCAEGFEGAATGVNAAVIQYHAFGDYLIEFESRIHSALALLRACRPTNPTDYGYMYVVQHVDYGQRTSPYQGAVLPYPDTPMPPYAPNLAPYFTLDCFGPGLAGCRTSREAILNGNFNAASTWTSKAKFPKFYPAPFGSPLFAILFRVRDNYQVLDSADLLYPFTFSWLCSGDGGLTYAPGCRYNNTTTRVHEVGGTIPAAWDNLEGFDTNSTVGRITAEGYVTKFGNLNLSCVAPGDDCHPIKLVDMFTGSYGTSLLPSVPKTPAFSNAALPERDVYFCNGQLCSETSAGAVPSGWAGNSN
jgi:hypothetical protein